jgi:hypothetical protein
VLLDEMTTETILVQSKTTQIMMLRRVAIPCHSIRFMLPTSITADNQVVNRSDRQRVSKWKILGGRPVTTTVRPPIDGRSTVVAGWSATLFGWAKLLHPDRT